IRPEIHKHPTIRIIVDHLVGKCHHQRGLAHPTHTIHRTHHPHPPTSPRTVHGIRRTITHGITRGAAGGRGRDRLGESGKVGLAANETPRRHRRIPPPPPHRRHFR